MIDITGLNKADVLAALYNASHPQGLGWLHKTNEDMTTEQAQVLLDKQRPGDHFDYVQGRVIKVNLTSDTEFDPYLYDRDNGQGAAQHAIDRLRQSSTTVISQ